jgi:hypothetical protein
MFRLISIAIALVAMCGSARADKIDGAWCNEAGGRVDIDGPKISLAGKTAFDGQYARHEFLYTVPAGEDHAGVQIYMRLQDEEDMTSFTMKDGKGVDPVAWKRCAQTS